MNNKLIMDRYSLFKINGVVKPTPFITIPKKKTDKEEQYTQGFSRLDIISNKFYKNPNYGYLILMANPEIGSCENDIPDYTILRIPYPLEQTLEELKNSIKNHIELNGV